MFAATALSDDTEWVIQAVKFPRPSTPLIWKRYFRELSVLSTLVVLLAVLAVFAPHFFDARPLLSRATAAAPHLLVTGGVAIVILCRQIDISVGSVFGVCSVVAGLMASHGWSMAWAAGASVALGALVGGLNGLLVAGLGLPSIVVTLATMVTVREALRLAQEGVFVNLPEGSQWLGMSMGVGQMGVCLAVVAIWLMLTAALHWVAAGRFFYAVGSDAEAARLAGLRPRSTTFAAFVLVGALTGVAAIFQLIQSPQVDPAIGRQLELEAIAAAVVGGVAISGGRGNLGGVLVGFLLLNCIGPGLTYLGVKPHWDKAIQGSVILLAVVADGLRRRPR